MDPILKLKNRNPLTHGRSRLVFEHPHDPDLLVKVIRPEVVEDRFGSKTKWYKKRRRFGKFISYAREIQEFIAVEDSLGKSPHFLQRIVGFARTDMGLGLVLEAVRWTDGTLAPNMATIINSGRFDDTAKKALAVFLDETLNSNVIISDLNLSNIVYTYSEERGYFFVLIDGIGNNSLLPFKMISRRINRRSKRGRYKRLHARIERCKSENQSSSSST